MSWILVKDKLPSNNKPVLCCVMNKFNEKTYEVLTYDKIGEQWLSNDCVLFVDVLSWRNFRR